MEKTTNSINDFHKQIEKATVESLILGKPVIIMAESGPKKGQYFSIDAEIIGRSIYIKIRNPK